MARKIIYLRQGFNSKEGVFISIIETDSEGEVDPLTNSAVKIESVEKVTYLIPIDNIAAIEYSAK